MAALSCDRCHAEGADMLASGLAPDGLLSRDRFLAYLESGEGLR